MIDPDMGLDGLREIARRVEMLEGEARDLRKRAERAEEERDAARKALGKLVVLVLSIGEERC